MGSFPHSCDTYSDCILLCPQRARPMLGKSPGSSRGGGVSRQEQRCHTPARQPFRLPHGLQGMGCQPHEVPGPLHGLLYCCALPRRQGGRWGSKTTSGGDGRDMAPGSRCLQDRHRSLQPWSPDPSAGSSPGEAPLWDHGGGAEDALCGLRGEPPGPPIRAGAGQGIHSPLQFGNVSPAHLQAPFLSSCPAGATGDVTIRGLL